MVELSFIVPGIRTHKWKNMYESIKNSYDGTFELIFVGPSQPEEIAKIDEIKFIQDFGSPIRCSQIGAIASTGKYLTLTADDCVYLSGKINMVVSHLEGQDNKTIVAGQYIEGLNPEDWTMQLSENYRLINFAYPKSPYVDDTWKMFNAGFMNTDYFKELGGWDCQFETPALGHADLAVRAYRGGANVIPVDGPILACEHLPGIDGDHGPIYYGHIEHDEPLYRKIYANPNCVNRIKVDLNNWTLSPPKWNRRFV